MFNVSAKYESKSSVAESCIDLQSVLRGINSVSIIGNNSM